MNRMRVVIGDITALKVDAVVNAANERMLGGGGVDGAIHRAAGVSLRQECKMVPEASPGVRCPTGEARITSGHELPAKKVIHAVGPVYSEGESEICEKQLASCYENSLRLAEENGIESIAFPCISTGAFAFPPERAAEIAFATVKNWVEHHELPKEVIFCCFTESDAELYRGKLE